MRDNFGNFCALKKLLVVGIAQRKLHKKLDLPSLNGCLPLDTTCHELQTVKFGTISGLSG